MLTYPGRGHLRNYSWDFPFRLAPVGRINRGGTTVRVREDARKCTVFLGHDASTKKRPSAILLSGTGFLVHAGYAGVHGLYLVTAAHVAKRLGSNPFVVRLNEKDGDGRLDHVDNAIWHYHSDNSVDVAITKYEPPDWADCAILPASEFMDRDRLEYYDIGPGDAAYIVGLFHLHAGRSRNLMVVHNGNIALMPSDEKIPTDDGEVEGYLVESQALQGASGSPVYIRPTLEFRARARFKRERDNKGPASIIHGEGRDYLLGVWVAAWPGKLSVKIATARGLPKHTWVPAGMGIVVPASHVSEVLFHPDRMKERLNTTTAEMQPRGTNKASRAATPLKAHERKKDRRK